MSDTVLVERDTASGVATVKLNRPERLNSLTAELMEALADRLGELASDDSVRVVIYTGEGDRALPAGADLAPPDATGPRERGQQTLEESIDQLKRFQESSFLLHTMPKPTIAAINGAVAGASFSMTAACDFRVAAEHAIMTTAFAKIGFSGDFGGSYFMTNLLGTAKARELYMLGERIDAEEALRIGLVHRVFPADTFRKETQAFAERLAEGPPLGYRYMKRNLNMALTANLRDILDLEAEAMMRTARSEDFRDAVGAFLSKQKPVFKGR